MSSDIEKDKEIERLKDVYEKNLQLIDKLYLKDKEIERLNNIIKEALILTENTRFEEEYASDEILLPIINKLRESGIRNYIKIEGSDK